MLEVLPDRLCYGSLVCVQLWHQYRPKNNIGQSKNFNAATAHIVEDNRVVQSTKTFHWMTCEDLFQNVHSYAQTRLEMFNSACLLSHFISSRQRNLEWEPLRVGDKKEEGFQHHYGSWNQIPMFYGATFTALHELSIGTLQVNKFNRRLEDLRDTEIR